MLNVQALTSTLSAMSLPQLQQYASLHKNDPYVVTMALSIANQKKQMQTAAQGQAGQQPMPKVVDQQLAEMAPRQAPAPQTTPMPEDVGIGQLPVPNIAKMAGGGIVAFSKGGDIPTSDFIRFLKDTGSSVDAFINGTPQQKAALEQAFRDAQPATAAGAQPATAATAAAPTSAARAPTMMEKGIMAVGNAASGLGNYVTKGLNAVSKVAPALTVGQGLFFTSPEELAILKKADEARLGKAAGETLKNLGIPEGMPSPAASQADVDAAITGKIPSPASPTPTPGANPSTSVAAPGAPQAPKKILGATPGTPSAPTAGIPNLITDAAGMQKALGEMQKGIKPQVPESIAQGIKDIQTAEETQAKQNLADIQAEQKARPPALKEFEARVKEKEGRLTKQEEMQGPMALLQAGFAIMGGTSPFALQNIGAGAQVGLKAYADGAEKLEAARDKIADSYGKIEEVRRNESRMDAKELREARNAALKPAIEAKKLTVSALEKDWGLSRQDATKGLEAIMANQRELFSQAEQTKRTGMQIQAQKEIAAMPPAEARTAMMLGTGKTDAEKIESGMRKMADISQEKNSAAFAKLYATHLDESNKNGVAPMSADAYAQRLQSFVAAMMPKLTSSLPNNAAVRTQ